MHYGVGKELQQIFKVLFATSTDEQLDSLMNMVPFDTPDDIIVMQFEHHGCLLCSVPPYFYIII
jgi:hypothetical protein